MKKIILLLLFTQFSTIAQQLFWTKQIPSYLATVQQMKMDSLGNFYLIGKLGAGFNNAPYIAKLDTQTNVIWYKYFTSQTGGNVTCRSIKIDDAGKIYIVGGFKDSLVFDNQVLYDHGNYEGFIISLDQAGQLAYSKIISGSGQSTVTDIDFDDIGQMYFTGGFKDSLNINSNSYFSTLPTAYLAKFRNDSLIWFKYSQGSVNPGSYCEGAHVKANNIGNVALTIEGYGDIVFDSLQDYEGCGGSTAIAFFNNNGSIHNLNSVGCYDGISQIITDQFNRFITAGQYSYMTSNSEAYRYPQSGGNGTTINGFGLNSTGRAIAIDPFQNNFISGNYSYPYPEWDSTIIYLNKCDINGVNLWSMYIPADYADVLSTEYNQGSVYVLGYFSGNLYTPDSLNSSLSNYFIAKINATQGTLAVPQYRDQELKIFPNPVSSIINVQSSSMMTSAYVCIRDVFGNCILNQKIERTDKFQIDMSTKPKGIYFMEIYNKGQKEIRKIILD